MTNVSEFDFKEEIARAEFFVSYTAMPDEVLFEPALWKNPPPKVFLVPNDYMVSPEDIAEKILEKTEGLWGAVFMPGQAFDEKGTRHGRGKGWYDRFLKQIPRGWLRVGVSTEKSFSSTDLVRKSWDEPVDWVLVKTNDGWGLYETG